MQWSERPSEQRSPFSRIRPPAYRPLTESEFSQLSEPIKARIRGLKLAQLQCDERTETHRLNTKAVQIEIAEHQHRQAREDFKTETFKLVSKRAQTSQAQDAAKLSVDEWGYKQSSAQTKLEELRLGQHNEQEAHSNNRRAAVSNFN
ncbi:MAG: hypothetical protein F6K36_29720 [Symploca sp. SIO3C6]|nr:hypothetical protein [Symploca sp. SIO3C6]